MTHPEAAVSAPAVPDSANLPGADAGDGWNRLHPASPLLRGGVVFLAITGIVIANLRDRLMSLFFGDWLGDSPSVEGDLVDFVFERNLILFVLLGVLGLVVLVMLGAWIGWRMHTYRISAEAVETKSGVLFRKHRRAPLHRIQGVNIQRPMIARLFGLAKLQVTTAGQDGTVELVYLSYRQAKQLRQVILSTVARARGEETPAPAVAAPTQALTPVFVEAPTGLLVHSDPATGAPLVQDPGAPGPRQVDPATVVQGVDPETGAPLFRHPLTGQPVTHAAWEAGGLATAIGQRLEDIVDADIDPLLDSPASLVRIPVARLLGSIALSWFTIITALMLAGVIVAGTLWERAILVALLPLGIAFVGILWGSFARGMNFVISNSAQGVRVSSGLLSTVTDTIPPGRIHAIELRQPLLWRAFGWWKIQITTAGFGVATAGKNQSVMLPVGKLDDAITVLGLLAPDHGLSADEIRRGATLSGPDGDYVTAPPRAGFLLLAGRQRAGIRLTDPAGERPGVLVRRGFLVRHLVLVPLARVQSTLLRRSLCHRMLGLASVQPQTVIGVVDTGLRGLSLADAEAVHERIARGAVLAGRVDRQTTRESA